jgi:Transposase domain (DUF772)
MIARQSLRAIGPELMMRMLMVGDCFGIRSERQLGEEVHLNLVCRLGLDGRVPDHSTVSRNRHGRFRQGDRWIGTYHPLTFSMKALAEPPSLSSSKMRRRALIRYCFADQGWDLSECSRSRRRPHGPGRQAVFDQALASRGVCWPVQRELWCNERLLLCSDWPQSCSSARAQLLGQRVDPLIPRGRQREPYVRGSTDQAMSMPTSPREMSLDAISLRCSARGTPTRLVITRQALRI